MRRSLLALALALWPAALSAQSATRAILTDKLRASLGEIARTTEGVLGAQIVDLATGERIGINDTLSFPTGSAIKVALLVELYRQADAGTLSLDTRLPVRAADLAGGSGVLQGFGDGTSELALRDLAVLMVVLSDNSATNMLVDRVGMERVNATMRSLGLGEIVWRRKMIRPRDSWAGRENVATPAAAASLMTRIAKCDLPMSRERCQALRRVLEIPKAGPLPASVPSTIRVAWKPGSLEGASVAWGIVDLPGHPYVVTAMVTYAGEAGADDAIRRVADAAYAYMLRVARASPYGVRVPLEIIR